MIRPAGGSRKERLAGIPRALRLLALALCLVALAGPRGGHATQRIKTTARDLLLVLDVSGSMLAEDLAPNRLEAAKAVARQFVSNRQDDRLGLVLFAGESLTQCPLTLDHQALRLLIDAARQGMVEDGTAIGRALATGVARLRSSPSRDRVLVLLTDGVENRGDIPPLEAAKLARAAGIRIYTVGIGSHGPAPFTVGGFTEVVTGQLDESVLRSIAELTGGRYFRAGDEVQLGLVFEEIDQLEGAEIETVRYLPRKDLSPAWALLAGVVLVVEAVLASSVFQKVP
jgi:Ca-activated chloride channel family protein